MIIQITVFRVGPQIGSDWPEIGQIWDFFVLKLILKSPRFVQFRVTRAYFGSNPEPENFGYNITDEVKKQQTKKTNSTAIKKSMSLQSDSL